MAISYFTLIFAENKLKIVVDTMFKLFPKATFTDQTKLSQVTGYIIDQIKLAHFGKLEATVESRIR